jgi:hypothetical protein
VTTQPLSTSWFGPLPVLAEGEEWVAHYAANRTQGKRAVGGALHITTLRMLFEPNTMESGMGGRAWSCWRDEIVAAGIHPGRFSLLELFSGGIVDRMLLELKNGRRELFVLNNLGKSFEEIRAILGVPIAQRALPKARVIKPGTRRE